MAFHLYEDTWETTSTTGTGDVTLGGAVAGWRAFSAQYANGDLCFYSLYDGTNYEHGIGTYNSGPNTLSRTTVIRSTNSNAAVNWGAGTRQIAVSQPGYAIESVFSSLLAAVGYPRQSVVGSAGTPATFVVDAPGQLVATATNDSASAGKLGEIINNSATGVGLSNGGTVNVTSVSLTAGDWSVTAAFQPTGAGGNSVVTSAYGGLNTITAGVVSLPGTGLIGASGSSGVIAVGIGYVNTAGDNPPGATVAARVLFPGTATLFLTCTAAFSAGSPTISGWITARRAR
jgi:hypothetical protein